MLAMATRKLVRMAVCTLLKRLMGKAAKKEKAANVSLILLKIILGIGKRGRLMILGWRKGGAWDSVAPPERSVKL